MSRRIGILGGTFDPPHKGHAQLARQARCDLPVQMVELIPNGQPPHRRLPQLPWETRLALCRTLVAGMGGVRVSADEPPGAPRWTIDTLLRHRKRTHGMILIMGADAFAQFHEWRGWRRILQLANIAVARRAHERHRISSAVRGCCRPVRRAVALSGGNGRVFFWRFRPAAVSSTLLRAKQNSSDLQNGAIKHVRKN